MSRIEIKKGEFILAMYPNEMKTLKQLISAPPDLFKSLYLKPLEDLSEYLQLQSVSSLDETPVIKRQLNYIINLLKIRRGKLLPEYADIETIAAQEAAWSYALFTLSMFKNMDCVLTHRHGSIYAETFEKLGNWHPFSGFFYESKASYDMTYSSEEKKDSAIISNREWAYFLVAKFIPPIAIRWLNQHETLFNAWQKTFFRLEGEETVLDRLLKLIDLEKAPAKSEENKKEETRGKINPIKAQTSSSAQNSLDSFLEELRKQINHPEIFLINSGCFVSVNVVDDICHTNKLSIDDILSELIEKKIFVKNAHGEIQFTLASKNITRQMVVKGFIFKILGLPEAIQNQLKTMTLNTEFSENLIP